MKRVVSALVKAAVTVLLFYLLFRKLDWRQFYATLAGARIGVLLFSFAILWIGHYICIFRWRILMRPLMPVFSLVRLFEIYCIGLFFNVTFPTAIGGDLVKMYYAGKPTRLYAQSFAATFLDRDLGMFAMMILACVGTLLIPMSSYGLPVSFIVWFSFAAFVALNVAIFTPVLHRILIGMLRKVRLTGIAARVDAISNAFVIMGKHPRILFQALLISLANQLLVFTVTWVTAIGLRMNVAYRYFLVFVPVISLITMIPISLNGTGLREWAFRSLFSAIGVAPASAVALGFLSTIMVLLSGVPGGIVYLFFRNRDDLRQMAALETEFRDLSISDNAFQSRPCKGTDLFSEQFDFSLPARVDFVGAGGKTGLILKLLEEYSQATPVLYTTTTRIHPPHPLDGLAIVSSDNEEYLVRLLEWAVLKWSCGRRFVVTHLESSPNLLRGVTPGFAEQLDRVRFPVILNEADGAHGMSLKMPRDGEPVLMTGSNYLVPIIGLDCLNKPLGPETLFRWDMASHRYHLPAGEILSPALAASLLLHPHGVCRDWKPGMRIVPFINKVDVEAEDPLADSLARALLRNGSFPIERVVYGSLNSLRARHVCA